MGKSGLSDGEPALRVELATEHAFAERAGQFARALYAAQAWPLVLGLRGDLGSGKTTWVRAMLRGLDFTGRVPSPTYTLLEQYACGGLSIVHLDLYRLSGDEELEHLGLTDWLAEPHVWVAVEWPDRAPQLAARCDLALELAITPGGGRCVAIEARTRLGNDALRIIRQRTFNNVP